jgi:tetratricopeptide (TPR) repeat protein
VAIDPRFGGAFNQLGYLHARTGDFAKAVQSFERYAELSPGLPNPIDSIAEMNIFLGNLDAAVAKYREALALKPDFYYSCLGLAYVHALQEDYAETENWLDEYVERAPTPQAKMEGLFQKGLYDYLLGRLDRSIPGLLLLRGQAEKFKFDTGLASVDLVTGYIYADKGDFDEARRAFQGLSVFLDARNPANRALNAAAQAFRLGWVELRAGRLEAARTRLEELEKLLPDLEGSDREFFEPDAALLRAEVALAENSPEQALGIGEKVLTKPLRNINTGNVVRYNIPFLKDVLARAHWKKGDLDKASAEYERLTKIDPKNTLRFLIPPLYHYRFGRVLEEMGERARARLEYEKFLKYWADADPAYPELKDARTRLASLQRAR